MSLALFVFVGCCHSYVILFMFMDSYNHVVFMGNSLQHHVEDGLMNNNEASSSEHEQSSLESVLTLNEDNQIHPAEELGSLISFETTETPHTEIIRQPSPPPVLADVQDLIPETPTQVSEVNGQMETPSTDGLVCSEAPLEMHIVRFLTFFFILIIGFFLCELLSSCELCVSQLKIRFSEQSLVVMIVLLCSQLYWWKASWSLLSRTLSGIWKLVVSLQVHLWVLNNVTPLQWF